MKNIFDGLDEEVRKLKEKGKNSANKRTGNVFDGVDEEIERMRAEGRPSEKHN